jgi:hypothetical protein
MFDSGSSAFPFAQGSISTTFKFRASNPILQTGSVLVCERGPILFSIRWRTYPVQIKSQNLGLRAEQVARQVPLRWNCWSSCKPLLEGNRVSILSLATQREGANMSAQRRYKLRGLKSRRSRVPGAVGERSSFGMADDHCGLCYTCSVRAIPPQTIRETRRISGSTPKRYFS